MINSLNFAIDWINQDQNLCHLSDFMGFLLNQATDLEDKQFFDNM